MTPVKVQGTSVSVVRVLYQPSGLGTGLRAPNLYPNFVVWLFSRAEQEEHSNSNHMEICHR